MGETELGIHFNIQELVWTLVAVLGLWACWDLVRRGESHKQRIIDNGWNGARLLAANSGIRRNKVRSIAFLLMFLVGILAGLYDDPPHWVTAPTVITLLLIGGLMVMNAILDNRHEEQLIAYLEKEDAVQKPKADEVHVR